MKTVLRFRGAFLAISVFMLLAFTSHASSTVQIGETVINSFDRTNGQNPVGNLIFDASGNLYGTTEYGGNTSCNHGYGCGVVFELTPTSTGWTETELYSFCAATSCSDGEVPFAGVTFDSAGNLYGTTEGGGTHSGGVVYELTPSSGGGWQETVLYSFCSAAGCADGQYPLAGVVLDAAGNLYGTTEYGGVTCKSGFCGVVFELTPVSGGGWSENVLYAFSGGEDGGAPYTSLIRDSAGNLYGTTYHGGKFFCDFGTGCGVVFELTPMATGGWAEVVLHAFTGGIDGQYPLGGLIFDSGGNLYGTTYYGGNSSNCGSSGCGVVFELTPTSSGKWREEVLHAFNYDDGEAPFASLTIDPAGNIYGTTYGGPYGRGAAFELMPTAGGWKYNGLYDFKTVAGGEHPESALILDPKGNLYGTTFSGGAGIPEEGTVFELQK